MISLAGFGRTVAFAAVAALASPWVAAVLSGVMGPRGAVATVAIGVTALYGAGIARRVSEGALAVTLTSVAGVAVVGAGVSIASLSVALAALLGALRSGLLQRDPRAGTSFARALAIELGLLGAGLALAGWLAAASAAPVPVAIWAFFLVQSAFFLIGGRDARAARSRDSDGLDPFERAHRRALSLLDEPGSV